MCFVISECNKLTGEAERRGEVWWWWSFEDVRKLKMEMEFV
jgi:hypothetical protein